MAFNLSTKIFIQDKKFHLGENKDIVLDLSETGEVNLDFIVTSATLTLYRSPDINTPVFGFEYLSLTPTSTDNGNRLRYKLDSAGLTDGPGRYISVFKFRITDDDYSEDFEKDFAFDLLDIQAGPIPVPTFPQYTDAQAQNAVTALLRTIYREVILDQLQTATGYGVTPAMALIITVNPSVGMTLRIKNSDGDDTFTFVASASAPFEVTIGATLEDTLLTLVNVINTDRTAAMAALCYNLTEIDAAIPVIAIIETGVTPGAPATRIWSPDLTAEIVNYSGLPDYSTSTRTTIPTADPAGSQAGFYRGGPALLKYEQHAVRETDRIIVWDKEGGTWFGLSKTSDPVDIGIKIGPLTSNYEIDLTVAGASTLLYNSGSHYTQVTGLVIKIIAEDTITVVPEISAGTNAPDYDNIIPATTLTGLDAANLSFSISVPQLTAQVIPAQDVYLNVMTPATAVTMTTDIDINGYEWA